MKYWKCPGCKRVRKWDKPLLIKICFFCQEQMIIMEDKNA